MVSSAMVTEVGTRAAPRAAVIGAGAGGICMGRASTGSVSRTTRSSSRRPGGSHLVGHRVSSSEPTKHQGGHARLLADVARRPDGSRVENALPPWTARLGDSSWARYQFGARRIEQDVTGRQPWRRLEVLSDQFSSSHPSLKQLG